MARTCDTDERWPHCTRPFIWWIGNREMTNRTTQLRFKNACKRDFQPLGTNTDSCEVTATDRDAWRHIVKRGLWQYEETQWVNAEEKRLHKKTVCLASRPANTVNFSKCGRDCHSRIGLHSHNRRCTMGANLWIHETERCQWIYIYFIFAKRPTLTNYCCIYSERFFKTWFYGRWLIKKVINHTGFIVCNDMVSFT